MRGLRENDPAEIIKYGMKIISLENLRASSPCFIPYLIISAMIPPAGDATNVTWALNAFKTTSTSYVTACQFQIMNNVSGCLNIQIVQNLSGGAGTAYMRFIADGSTLWSRTATGYEVAAKSFPDFESAGELYVEIKSSNVARTATLRISKIFLSSRPYFSY